MSTASREGRPGFAPVALDSPLPQPGAAFGIRAAVGHDLVAIGAPGENLGAGEVFLFNRITGNFVRSLSSPHAEQNGFYGWTVTIAGNLLVVGADQETVNGLGLAGRAYTYELSTGALRSTISSPNAQAGGFFGISASAFGSDVLVGADRETVTGLAAAGHAYLFEARTGHLESTWTSGSPETNGNFGFSVALGSRIAVVGAPGETSGGLSAVGHAYVFDPNSNAFETVLQTPHPQAFGEFGFSLSVFGDLTAVGAWGENSGGRFEAGRAYTFNAKSGELLASLVTPHPVRDGRFGLTVAVNARVAFVGATFETARGILNAGHTYEFSVRNGALLEVLSSPHAVFYGRFGAWVTLHGSTLVVGAVGETTNRLADAGRAYDYTSLSSI